MVFSLRIAVPSEGLFDEIYDHFSNHETFSPGDEGRFAVNNLRFIRVQGQNDQPGSDLAGLNWGQGDSVDSAACLDEEYTGLQNCFDTGMRTIWMNREGELAPEDIPVQDEDFLSLDDLLKVETVLQKPTLRQCYAWWDEWNLPDNIRRHVKTVAWGAYVLAVKMRNKGIKVDPILTHRGGMMHDIDKINTLDKAGQHGEMGAKFLLQQGYPAMAKIVREHIMNRIMHPEAEDLPWEVKLVYFVDKLVEGDQIVTFDIRRKALMQRYPGYRRIITTAAPKIYNLSDQISSILSLSTHEQLIGILNDK